MPFFLFRISQDGFVAFRRGELLCGNLGKKTLGGDSKSGLFYVLIRDFGALQVNKWARRQTADGNSASAASSPLSLAPPVTP
jgi:hypothetical protein